jgi:flagellar M-ring protein FliF
VATESQEGAAARAESSSTPNFWLIALLVISGLFALYWFAFRSSYVPVLVNLDPQDAAEVAKVLDAKKIDYRLEAEGRTIAVLESEADKARIELAGSEMPMKGQIGFELFNQSDMGLTEFAQKINYLRALQGELARTILLLDGIQTVRVHLGLPERSLFRGEQEQPRASVTLILKPGKALSSGTVAGIQRLVAGAVPELTLDAVAVLDGTGRVISADAPPAVALVGNDAVIAKARNGITAAIAAQHADLRFSVIVSLRYARTQQDGASEGAQDAASAQGYPIQEQSATISQPQFSYAVRLTTQEPLDDAMRSDLQKLVMAAIDFKPERGDSLAFDVGPVQPEQRVQSAPSPAEKVVSQVPKQSAQGGYFAWQDWWAYVIALLGIAMLGGIWLLWRKRSKQKSSSLGEFAELLRTRLEADEVLEP